MEFNIAANAHTYNTSAYFAIGGKHFVAVHIFILCEISSYQASFENEFLSFGLCFSLYIHLISIKF